MNGRASRSLPCSSPSGECSKFETHPYRRTSLCKNCSKTREQHEEETKSEVCKGKDEDAIRKNDPSPKNGKEALDKWGKPESSDGMLEMPKHKTENRMSKSTDAKISTKEKENKSCVVVSKSEKAVFGLKMEKKSTAKPEAKICEASKSEESVSGLKVEKKSTAKPETKICEASKSEDSVSGLKVEKKSISRPETKICEASKSEESASGLKVEKKSISKPETKIHKTSKVGSAVSTTKLVRSHSAESSKTKGQRSGTTAVEKQVTGVRKETATPSSGTQKYAGSAFLPGNEAGLGRKLERSRSVDNNDVTCLSGCRSDTSIRRSLADEKSRSLTGLNVNHTKKSSETDMISSLDRKSLKKSYNYNSRGKAEADISLGDVVNHQLESVSFRVSGSDNRLNAAAEADGGGELQTPTKSYPGETEKRRKIEEGEGKDDRCRNKTVIDASVVDIAERSIEGFCKNVENMAGVGPGGNTSALLPGPLLRDWPLEALAAVDVTASGRENGKLIVRELPCTTSLEAAGVREEEGKEEEICNKIQAAGELEGSCNSTAILGKSVSISGCCESDISRTDGFRLQTKSYRNSTTAATADQRDLRDANESEKKKLKSVGHDVLLEQDVINVRQEVIDDIGAGDSGDKKGWESRSETSSSFRRGDTGTDSSRCRALQRNIVAMHSEREGDMKGDQQKCQNRSIIDDANMSSYYLDNLNFKNSIKKQEDILTSPSSTSEVEDSNDESDDNKVGRLGNFGARISFDYDDDGEDEGEYNLSSVFGQKMFDRLFDKNNFLEAECDKLLREKTVLVELLASKKSELDDTMRRNKTRIQELEEETQKLKSEKNRLLEALKMPECERMSLTSMENEIAELKRKLDEWESSEAVVLRENNELKEDIRDLELEILEMHDQFNKEESLELRELRKELENASRDCRLLHFKVRKAERRNEQLRLDCEDSREKISAMEREGKTSCVERKKRIEELEEQLQEAREVSIRLHDECERMENDCRRYKDEIAEMKERHSREKTNSSSEASNKLCDISKNTSKRFETRNELLTENSQKTNDGDWHLVSNREEELKLQLAMADQETKSLQRKLDEIKFENEKLMEAVKYLRFKMESSKSGKKEEEKEKIPQFSMESGSSGDTAFHKKYSKISAHSIKRDSSLLRDDQEDEENLTEILEERVGFLDTKCRRLSEDQGNGNTMDDVKDVDVADVTKNLINNKLEAESQSTKFWKNRVLDLENEIKGLADELKSALAGQDRLRNDTTRYRKDMDAMLETLRRKEKQFADERKGLQRKNKELSEVFDLLTEKAERRHQQRKEMDFSSSEPEAQNACSQTEDEYNQDLMDELKSELTDKESIITELSQEIEDVKRQHEEAENESENRIKFKDDVIQSRDDVINRKEYLLGRAVTSLQEMEKTLGDKCLLIEEKDRLLVLRDGEIKEKVEELRRAEEERKDMEEKIASLWKNMDHSRKELAEKGLILDKMSKQMTEKEEEMGIWKTIKCELESQLKNKETEFRKTTEDKEIIKAKLEMSENDTKELKIRLDMSENEMKELKIRLEMLKNDAKRLSDESENTKMASEQKPNHHFVSQEKDIKYNTDTTQDVEIAVEHLGMNPTVGSKGMIKSNRAKLEKSNATNPSKLLVHIDQNGRKIIPIPVAHETSGYGEIETSGYGDMETDLHQSEQAGTCVSIQSSQPGDQSMCEIEEQSVDGDGATVSRVRFRKRDTSKLRSPSIRRSRSMTEFNVFSNDPDSFYTLVPLQPISMTPFSSTTITSTPTSTLAASSEQKETSNNRSPPCSASPDNSPAANTHDEEDAVVVRRIVSTRRTSGSNSKCITSGSNRGSFYASGTVSARVSRDSSPNRSSVIRKQLSPYPVAPPSMIITPCRTPMRAESVDRGPDWNSISQSDMDQLWKELEKFETRKTKERHESCTASSNNRIFPFESKEPFENNSVPLANDLPSFPLANALSSCELSSFSRLTEVYRSLIGRRKTKEARPQTTENKRSSSVSPRTARRRFFEDYPYDARKQQRQQEGKMAADRETKAAVVDEMSASLGSCDWSEQQETSICVKNKNPNLEKGKDSKSTKPLFHRFSSTLPFFKKKSSYLEIRFCEDVQHPIEDAPSSDELCFNPPEAALLGQKSTSGSQPFSKQFKLNSATRAGANNCQIPVASNSTIRTPSEHYVGHLVGHHISQPIGHPIGQRKEKHISGLSKFTDPLNRLRKGRLESTGSSPKSSTSLPSLVHDSCAARTISLSGDLKEKFDRKDNAIVDHKKKKYFF